MADAQKLLALCRRAGQALQEGALFSAHGALQRLQFEHFQEWSTTAEKARCDKKMLIISEAVLGIHCTGKQCNFSPATLSVTASFASPCEVSTAAEVHSDCCRQVVNL